MQYVLESNSLIAPNRLGSHQTEELWNSLNDVEKAELFLSYAESLNPNNLISHEQIKKQHDKWLGKLSERHN